MRATALRIGLQSLRLHPLRTLLSTLGVVIGSASLAAVLSIGDGAEQFARQRIAREGLTRVTLEARTADEIDGHRIPRAHYPVFTPADAEAVARAVPDATVTLETTGTAVALRDGTPRAVRLVGQWTTTAAPSASDDPSGDRAGSARPALLAGRWVTDDEMRAGRPVAVVSEAVVRTLLDDTPPEQAPGHYLRLGAQDFTIVGVLGGDIERRAASAVAPLQPVEAALVPVVLPRARVLHLDLTRAEDTAGARLRLERVVQAREAWRGDTRIATHGPERLRDVAQALRIMKLLLGAFASISLVVGGIGIMNVLLASVTERMREIGIRKAVGARRRDIVAQFLAEAVVITTTGALLGVVLGLTTAFAVTALVRARTDALLYASVTVSSVVISVAIALVVGLAFGVYPALRAARLPPIDAIVRE